MAWTNYQKAAIDSRKGNYLVSAGAGSGKTAVLTERIKQIVLDGEKEKAKGTPEKERVGASVDELLVLTFTNKAAAEMKSRIRTSLLKAYQNGELKNDVSSLVESSDITTFDSYFYSLVKKYHYELGIDEDMEIADSVFFTLKQKQIIDEIFLSHYEKKDKSFLDLFPVFGCIKDDTNISDMVENVLSVASQTVDPIAFMRSLSTDFLTDEYFEKRGREWDDCLEKKIQFIEKNAEKKIESKEVSDYLLTHTAALRDIVRRGCSQSEASEYKASMNRDFHFRPESAEESKSNKKYPIVSDFDFHAGSELKDKIKEILGTIIETAPFEVAKGAQKGLKANIETISSLAIEVYEALNKFKKENNVYDFADIAAMAREILDDPAIRQSIASSYKYVMVDEYQDTSDLQEDFLLKVTNDNLFAVGDIKQSIYRFRNANPKIFGEKFDAYNAKKGGNLITLNSNFRSSKNVIDDMNSFFGETMSLETGGIEYDENQKMIFGNADLYGASTKDEYATQKIVYEKKKTASENIEEEARLVALDILSKVGKYQVFDGETRKLRPARFEDFVILSRGKKCFQTFVRVFSDYKIPLLTSDKIDLSGKDVSLLFKRFLRLSLAIEHDEKEEMKHSYASIMRSYLYRKKDSEIVSRLEDGSYSDSDFFLSFKKLNKELCKMPPSEAVEKLLSVYPFFDKLPTIGHLVDNYENISFFRKTAKTCERLKMDYEQFCSFFVDIEKNDISPSLDAPAESKGAARIMTIHASKGLEFPLVYIVSNDTEFNGKVPNISKNYGVLLDFADTSIGENPLIALMKNEEMKENTDEEIRILYVAFTRAKQKLIIVKSEGKKAEFYPMVSSYLAFEEKKKEGENVPTWTLKTLNSYSGFYNLSETFAKFGKLDVKVIEDNPDEPKTKDASEPDAKDAPELRSICYEPERIIKARASKNEAMKLEDYAKVAYGLRMHRILECVSFIKKDLSFLPEGYEKRKISAILAHPFWNDMDNAKEFHEYSFYDETQGIHGSIDLLIVKDDVCDIVDFKSHKVDDPAYRKQLGAYKAYVEKTFGKKARTYLLSIADASIVELE